MDIRHSDNILRLVNYDSSSDSDQGEKEEPFSYNNPAKKKPKMEDSYENYPDVSYNSSFCSASDYGGKVETPLECLVRMGFSMECVEKASAECDSIDVDDILEYLIDGGEQQREQQLHVLEVPFSDEHKGLATTPSQKLQQMGFTFEAMLKASEKCNSVDVDEILEYLIDGEQEKAPTTTDSRDSGEMEAVQRLQEMGFCIEDVQEASEKCNSIDIDDILECLMDGSDEVSSGTESDDDPLATDGSHIRDWKSVQHCKDAETPTSKGGSSSSSWDYRSVKLKWSKKEVDLWYSYLGGLRRINRCNILFSRRWGRISEKLINITKMTGFGIPSHFVGRPSPLPKSMEGPPYFYFENVAGAPKTEWETIKRHFNGVEPELVDSMFFSACRRARGYVHNLPLEGREPMLPAPPMTISEALPNTVRFWPDWDTRERLNCITTVRANDSFCGLIRNFFKSEVQEIPTHEKHEILRGLKKWNLVWVGPGQVAPLEPHEIELFLGFDKDHTRGCSGISHRHAALGNSFQVDTIAYHLSPLRYLYPDGIVVLSLFSGIGGGEVALHKIGLFLKVLVVVEINAKLRAVIWSWWKKTLQKGELILKEDVKELTYETLSGLMDKVGKIDLIIGGSPCNNLSGNNRVSRFGLSGKESNLFFEFPRILNIVQQIMRERCYT